jgi:hypothetical protein
MNENYRACSGSLALAFLALSAYVSLACSSSCLLALFYPPPEVRERRCIAEGLYEIYIKERRPLSMAFGS